MLLIKYDGSSPWMFCLDTSRCFSLLRGFRWHLASLILNLAFCLMGGANVSIHTEQHKLLTQDHFTNELFIWSFIGRCSHHITAHLLFVARLLCVYVYVFGLVKCVNKLRVKKRQVKKNLLSASWEAPSSLLQHIIRAISLYLVTHNIFCYLILLLSASRSTFGNFSHQ